MSTYLITGVAGFIGARTAEMLLAAGHAVVGVDNLNDYYDVRLKQHRLDRLLAAAASGADFCFEAIDIEDAVAVGGLFGRRRFEAVINLAARAGVRYSIDHPEVYVTTNVLGATHLLAAMVAAGVKKYVLASSSSLYAGSPAPFVETANVSHPQSPYAASKLAAEAMAYTYHHLHAMDVTVLRYFTVFGPAGRPDMSPLRFLRWIDEGTPIELFGDGSQSRDFTYVDDIAAGTIAALKPVGFEVINLGGGNEPMSINAMIAVLEARLGRKAVINYRPFNQSDMRDTQADIGKAARLLGWAPTVSPEEGFGRMADWYEANREWMRQISL